MVEIWFQIEKFQNRSSELVEAPTSKDHGLMIEMVTRELHFWIFSNTLPGFLVNVWEDVPNVQKMDAEAFNGYC